LLGVPEEIADGVLLALLLWLIFLLAMPQYTLFIWNKHRRIKYPGSIDLPDAEAAREVATRLARVFTEVIPDWNDLSSRQQRNFVVEVVDEEGRTVLTVPFRDAEESEP
jgi:hypothetical protein